MELIFILGVVFGFLGFFGWWVYDFVVLICGFIGCGFFGVGYGCSVGFWFFF